MRTAFQTLLFAALSFVAFTNTTAAELDIRDPDGKTIIPADQIRSYDWSTHTLTLKPGQRIRLGERLSNEANLPGAKHLAAGIPFIVALDGNPIYEGKFTTSDSSFNFETPVIAIEPVAFNAAMLHDRVRIQLGHPTEKFFKGDDPRGDNRIKEALRAAGKLTNTHAAELDIRGEDGAVIIPADKIKSYHWTTHTLTLAPDTRGNLFADLVKTQRLVSGIPFSLCIDGKPIYEGKITTNLSSYSFDTPVIVLNAPCHPDGVTENLLSIQLGYPTPQFFVGHDPRDDKRIEEALMAEGKLAFACTSPATEFDIRDERGTVLIAADQIKSYNRSTHMLTLTPDTRKNLYYKLSKTEGLVSGRPFTVCVGGTPIYEGKFTTSASSFSFDAPVIVVDPIDYKNGLKENELVIQLGYPNNEFFKGDDPRSDDRIQRALLAAGKLDPPCEDHAEWVAKVLREIQTIKPGMTRKDLKKVFTEEGGLSNRFGRRYVHRACPLIKVDVKFDWHEPEANSIKEHPKDKITQISTPFLEWTIAD